MFFHVVKNRPISFHHKFTEWKEFRRVLSLIQIASSERSEEENLITADRSEPTGGVGGGGGGGSSLVSPTSSSAKRRHISSNTSKHSPVPWKLLSPAETLFRILCPAGKTGGVIGKGGSIVRQFREETGARIRIDDAVPGSADRVIHIVADAAVGKSEGAGVVDGEDSDASPAQRALLKVFERIVKVDEERIGEVPSGDEKEITGPVMCRLLAPNSQVGCVLGKGGKIIEKIRQESGAQIRILSNEHVPVCAAAGDELIQISGAFLAVKKALLSVSSCLQDNPRADVGNLSTPKSFEPGFNGNLAEGFSPGSFISGHHVQEYHSRAYSTSIDVAASRQKRGFEEEVVFRMLCSNEKVGSLIGKGGIIIRTLQSDTGANIKIIDGGVPDCEEKIIVISAYESSDANHSPTQDAVLRIHSRLTETGTDKGSAIARLLVPLQQIGCLLGKGGNIIAEMRRSTGASIRIFLKEQVPRCAQPNDEVVQVTGNCQSVQEALFHIIGRIRETILSSKAHLNMGTASFPHGLDRSSSFSYPRDWQSSSSHSADRSGVSAADRASFPYSGEVLGSNSCIDHSASFHCASTPKAPSTGARHASERSPKFLSESSFGSGSGGIQVPAEVGKTLEVTVPQEYLVLVCGDNDNDLDQIREFSGANIIVHDSKPDCAESLVTISGSADQVFTAQSLLHSFIVCGKIAAQ